MRGRIPPLPLESVPKVDPAQLPEEERERYKGLSRAIDLYYKSKSMHLVEEAAGCSDRNFRRLMKRFWAMADDGKPMGYRALILQERVTRPVRYRPICDANGKIRGTAGIFDKLLNDYPPIRRGLIRVLEPKGKRDLQPNRIQMGYLHDELLTLCSKAGITADRYPFNTATQAIDGLRRWYRQVYLADRAREMAGYEPENDELVQFKPAPYRLWQIDEVRIDARARHETLTDDLVWVSRNAARATGVLVKDVDMGLNCSFEMVLGPAATLADLLTTFWKAISGPTPVTPSIAGLEYAPGAGYPAAVLPALRYAIPMQVQLDNAFAHLADDFRTVLHTVCGVIVTLGRPRTPKSRGAVEAELAVHARNLMHQVPATTGTGPLDPIRKQADVPVDQRLRTNELAHVVDVYWANKNLTPCRASYYQPPLGRATSILNSGRWEPVTLPPNARSPYFFGHREERDIQTEPETTREPFIYFKGRRYVGECIKPLASRPNKRVVVRSNHCDLRKVAVFELDGGQIGELRAEGAWGIIPHDERIRRLYATLRYQAQLQKRPDREPLRWLLMHLRERAPRDANMALALAHVMEYLLPRVQELKELQLFEAAELLKEGRPRLHLVSQPLPMFTLSEAAEDETDATTNAFVDAVASDPAEPAESQTAAIEKPRGQPRQKPPRKPTPPMPAPSAPAPASAKRAPPRPDEAVSAPPQRPPALRRRSNVIAIEPEPYLLPKRSIRR